jgi:thiol-disulfide isomerase/thioredoxin
MKKQIAVATILLTTAAIGSLIYNWPAKESLPVETVAPTSGVVSFTLSDLDGNPRDFSEWDGKARLVNFWATWCAPCRREIPLLIKIQAEHGENNVQVIGVAVDFIEQVAAYAEDAEFNYPILVGQEDAMAAAEATGIDFIGMPFTMIVAPDGQLIKTHLGEIVEEHLELIVEVFERMRTGELDMAGARAVLGAL